MKKVEKMKRNLAALGSMMFGTVLVLGTLILINDSENLMTKADGIDGTNIKIQKQKPKPKQEIRKPKPKPKPKRARQAPPTPLLGLNSSLGGLDLGLPDFSMDGLNGLDGDILGNGSGVIMTDDTSTTAVGPAASTSG